MDIDAANQEAMGRILNAEPYLEDFRPAIEVVPGMRRDLITHAGPPIPWEQMSGPTQGAVIGAALYEELVKDPGEVPAAIREGRIQLGANHDHACVGPMAGPITASTPVYVVRNRHGGNVAFASISEGLGKVLAMGAYTEDVLERLRWVARVHLPILRRAIQDLGGIDLRAHIAEALLRGDEVHNRNKAATSMLVERLTPVLLHSPRPREDVEASLAFLTGNSPTFVTLAMAACKVTLDAASGVPGSTVVTAYARNGATVGLRVSGLGDRWFVGPAPRIKSKYFPGFSEADACPDLGDSAIVECGGLGAFVLAASPAMTQLLGGTAQDAVNRTLEMYEITLAEHPVYRIPFLDFRGAPIGIDVRKVVRTGILPSCNTATAHREAGKGMIGAGMVQMPMICFQQALAALAEMR